MTTGWGLLHDLDGRKEGSIDGYGCSDAIVSADVVWNVERLDAFIADPDAIVPGNAMKPYSGLTDEEVRERIVTYLSGDDT